MEVVRLCCSLILAVQTLAQTSPRPGGGLIEGRVIDAATGEPIGQAKVSLSQIPIVMGIRPGNMMGDNFYDDSQMPARQVTSAQPVLVVTDDAGNFRVTVNAGRHHVRAERSGYGAAPAGVTSLSLIPGETLKGVTLKLIKQATIAGRVVDGDSQPLAFVRVQCLKWTLMGHNGQRVLTQQSTSTTDDKGEYRILGLTPGKYIVSAEAGPNVPGFRMPPTPDRTAYVTVFAPGVTDLASAQALDLAPGASRQGVDFRMQPVPVVDVSGKVTGAGPGTMISLQPRNPALMMANTRQYSTLANPDGSFVLQNVPADQYVLNAVRQTQDRRSARMDLDVAGTNVTGLTVALQPALTLKGQIHAEDAPTFEPVALESLNLYFQPQSFVFSTAASARVDREGRFIAGPLDPGTYRIQPGGLPSGYYVKSIQLGDAAGTDELRLTPGTTGEVVVRLEWGTAEINGKVLDRKGRPASDILVIVVNARGETVRGAISLIDGQYKINELPPGVYRVFPVVDADIADPDTLDRLAAAGKKVTLAKSGREARNLEVPGEQPAKD